MTCMSSDKDKNDYLYKVIYPDPENIRHKVKYSLVTLVSLCLCASMPLYL